MKNLPYILITLISLSNFLACSNQAKKVTKTPNVQEVVVIDDGYKTDENGNLLIDDGDLKGRTLQITTDKSEESTRTSSDGSQVKVMKDGYGNKTITRYFYNHPLISGIVARVSARGKSKIFIYTKDGLVKQISNRLHDLVESASATEIAKQVGIYSLNDSKTFRPMIADRQDEYQNSMSLPNMNISNSYPLTEMSEPPAISQTEHLQKEEVNAESEVKKIIPIVADNTFINEFETKMGKTIQVTKIKPRK